MLDLTSLIYNSIKDSDFTFNYIHNIINLTSKNFGMNFINYILIDGKQLYSFDSNTRFYLF